jgi:hypothetical protein
MTPARHLASLQDANLGMWKAEATLLAEHRRFGQMIARQRKISRSAFARKLGITGAMLALMEDGERRWRVLSVVKDDAEQAKDAFKTIKGRPGSLPVANTGDEAAHAVVQPTKGGPKIEMLVARKGKVVWAVMDEGLALGGAEGEKARLTKDEATAKMKPLLEKPAPATTFAPAPSTAASAAPKK